MREGEPNPPSAVGQPEPADLPPENFVQEQGARVIVRGLRAVSDFEYEFQMAGMNSYLNDDIETMFLMAQDKHQLISSRFVKEIAKLGGDVSHFVTPNVVKALKKQFSK